MVMTSMKPRVGVCVDTTLRDLVASKQEWLSVHQDSTVCFHLLVGDGVIIVQSSANFTATEQRYHERS